MPSADEQLRPLSARSTVLSLMLGITPDARLSPAELARAAAYFDIAPATVRVALTRAVAAGDLVRVDGDYSLGGRLAARQRRQDEGVEDAETAWGGDWELAAVTVTGRPGPERAALRELLVGHRLGELREGLWMRPANLRRPTAYAANAVLRTFRARPDEDPAELAASLWDLDAWARAGHDLVDLMARVRPPALRLAAAARLVRHLAEDPLLPAELLPVDWPGAGIRDAYAAYQGELRRDALAPT